MKPSSKPPSVVRVPHAFVAICLLFSASTAMAGPHKKGPKGGPKPTAPDSGSKPAGDAKPKKAPTLDFTGINFQGTLHTPQLLYFLDRANEELERASLERRSFIPEMVKSVDEDDL